MRGTQPATSNRIEMALFLLRVAPAPQECQRARRSRASTCWTTILPPRTRSSARTTKCSSQKVSSACAEIRGSKLAQQDTRDLLPRGSPLRGKCQPQHIAALLLSKVGEAEAKMLILQTTAPLQQMRRQTPCMNIPQATPSRITGLSRHPGRFFGTSVRGLQPW